jgi:hypothetical protein
MAVACRGAGDSGRGPHLDLARPGLILRFQAQGRGNRIDVPDPQVDEGVGARIARVLGQEQPDAPARDGHECGHARPEAVLRFFGEPEPVVPGDGSGGIGHA